jgi:XTP/dITP diphosphohydrolase
MELYFITSNKGKLREIRELLGVDIKSKSIDIEEIQGIEAEKVAVDKAKRAYAMIKKPIMIEDTALYINALNGFPGALIKFMEIAVGYGGICRMLRPYKDKRATAEACIVLYDGKRLKIFSGRAHGSISDRIRGNDGFGFDSIFIPDGYSRTFAEMGTSEKNKVSHRMKAVLKLKKYLVSESKSFKRS